MLQLPQRDNSIVTLLFFLLPLLHSGWFWLWPAHLPPVCQVFPGRPAALLYGGLWYLSCYILEGEISPFVHTHLVKNSLESQVGGKFTYRFNACNAYWIFWVVADLW